LKRWHSAAFRLALAIAIGLDHLGHRRGLQERVCATFGVDEFTQHGRLNASAQHITAACVQHRQGAPKTADVKHRTAVEVDGSVIEPLE